MRLRKAISLSLLMTISSLAIACRSSSSNPMAAGRWYSGRWVGTITRTGAVVGSLTLTINDQDDGFFTSGTWEAVFPNSASNDRGSLSIPVTQTPPSLGLFLYSDRSCIGPTGQTRPTLIVDSVVVNNVLSGKYQELGCALPLPEGQINLRKQ